MRGWLSPKLQTVVDEYAPRLLPMCRGDLLMYLFGFYIASIVYIFICLLFFRIEMKYILLVLICMAALIYGTFDVFLNVPLPDGIIMEEFL